ncbi:S8 family serine peptidase, partial [Gracilibacillus dipsosauri]|uniref:S8 family serine peptidase n=1 Tax=Gracilibacillus dipsosauri TaxID=178340 RepID=UPI002408FDB2
RVLKGIQQDDAIVFAEPDYIRTSTFVPNDVGYAQQWYLNRIQMPQAWEIEKGSSDVTIAVLDTGINANHPDLIGRVLPGYDFVNEDNDPTDDHWHGTFVSGIIAANVNEVGIAGLDHFAKILPVKVANHNGDLTVTDIVEGIYYAIEQEADVINMSFSSYHTSEAEQLAIQDAHEAGIVLVAASGNDSKQEVGYPAAHPSVISVGATNQNDRIATFSNYGNSMDITAPGVDIYSTHHSEKYAKGEGTSFSAPIVSAIAGLLKAKNPEWSNTEIEWALLAGANSLSGKEWDSTFGYGMINAFNSLSLTLPKWEDAPNRKKDAQLLSETTIHEAIDYPSDTDWFSMIVEDGASVTIDITQQNQTNDLVVILHEPNGNTYKINNRSFGEGESYSFQGKSGIYYVEIYDAYNHWSEKPFEITISGIAPDIKAENVVHTTKPIFRDVKLYHKEISYLTDLGVIKGYPDGTFKPDKPVTRLQAIQMIMNQMGVEYENSEVENPNFTDVTPTSYGYKAIAKAVELGIVRGKADGSFNPNGTLTRWEMATILVNAYQLSGEYNGEFIDVPKSHFAYEPITKLAANNITKGYGDNTFRPLNVVSRAHFSVFLYNYLMQ